MAFFAPTPSKVVLYGRLRLTECNKTFIVINEEESDGLNLGCEVLVQP